MSNSFNFKVVVIGAEANGKTALIGCQCGKKFPEKGYVASANMVVSTTTIKLPTRDATVKLEIFDIPGSSSMMVLNRMYLRDTNAALICYDVTKPDSLQNAEKWVNEVKEYGPSEIVLACCGTNMDAPGIHAITQNDGSSFARKHGLGIWMECSSKTKERVANLFTDIAMQCFLMKDKFVSFSFVRNMDQPERRSTIRLE